ncbi:MAG TPA: HutD family protein [Rhodopseudomonas sp.]
MRIIRASSCKSMPWKNGGGSTTEIAASPRGASLETFDWRISMARVASDGPFSSFPGVDRTLAIVQGHGLELIVGGAPPLTLTQETAPVAFAGDVATQAKLIDGETTDLNVMTRRGRWQHRLLRCAEATRCEFEDCDIAVVVALRGRIEVITGSARETLAPRDAALLQRDPDFGVQIVPAEASACYLVLLRPAALPG